MDGEIWKWLVEDTGLDLERWASRHERTEAGGVLQVRIPEPRCGGRNHGRGGLWDSRGTHVLALQSIIREEGVGSGYRALQSRPGHSGMAVGNGETLILTGVRGRKVQGGLVGADLESLALAFEPLCC